MTNLANGSKQQLDDDDEYNRLTSDKTATCVTNAVRDLCIYLFFLPQRRGSTNVFN